MLFRYRFYSCSSSLSRLCYNVSGTVVVFLQDFLESEGIVVNEPDQIPEDPYLATRTKAAEIKQYNTPSSFDKLKQFLELDRKVLRFFCVWDDRDAMFGEMRPFILHVGYKIQLFITIKIF